MPVGLYLTAAALCAGSARADGYDGVGFVLAMQRLDLARFAPQPPGYPLYVLLGRLVQLSGLPAAAALSVVSAVLLGGGIGAVAAAAQRRLGFAAGVLIALFLSLSPLCLALGVATLSDGAGLGALLLSLAVLSRGGRLAACGGGVLIGAALGIRPTYAPIALLLLLFYGRLCGWRAVAWSCLSAAAAVLAWLVPFALWVGPQTLWGLSLAHATGHVTDFGGAVTADAASGVPIVALVRGLVESALGLSWPLAGALFCAAVAVRRPGSWAPATRRLAACILWGLFGYCLFALIALQVRAHARHLLPAVAALLFLGAVAVDAALAQAAGWRRLLLLGGSVLLVVLLAATTARTLWAFRQPSPGAALAQYVAAHYPKGTLLYGGRAARYLDLQWGSGTARPTLHFGDVTSEAERLDHLPAEVLCTSEVQASAASQRALRPVARFCYLPQLPQGLRLDPFVDGCVELRAYRFRP